MPFPNSKYYKCFDLWTRNYASSYIRNKVEKNTIIVLIASYAQKNMRFVLRGV